MAKINTDLITQEDAKEWLEKWGPTMLQIWRDRLIKYKVGHSPKKKEYSLRGSLAWESTDFSGVKSDVVKITHNFLTYGIFVDLGTGREMGGKRNSKGQLVNAVTRTPKPWFSKGWYRSVMVAKEFMAKAYGDEFKGILFKSARELAKEAKRG